MRTLAIVPVKGFGEAKQRLSASLAPGARSSLAQAMFSDVLAALGRARRVDGIVVVTDDPVAQQLAHGKAVVLRDGARAGQSVAASIGVRHALENGFERVLMVPGDTPLVDPIEIDTLLARTVDEGIAVGIVADRHGTGTNALVLTPPDVIEPAFGPDSLERHVGLGVESGLPHRIEHAPTLAHDVDTPEDLAALRDALVGVRGRAQRTWGAVHQIDNCRSRPPTTPVEVQA